MNKRKLLALALTLCMVAILAIGGTLAYFTDTDSAVNVFTFGNVKIRQDEWQRDEETKVIEEFVDDQNVFPAIHDKLTKGEITVDGYTFNIRSQEGNYIDKIVNVTNEGNNDAYIRTIIAVPSINGWDDDKNASENPLHWNYLDATDFINGIGWDWNGSKDAEATDQKEYAQNVMIDGVAYDLYVATYNKAVAPEGITSPSMVGFYLDDDVDFDADKNKYVQFKGEEGERDLSPYLKPDATTGKVTMNILVATQACQTEGFENAWEALDEAFGAIDATNHPWIAE